MREGAKANTVQCAIGASWCAVQYWPCSRPSSMYDSSELSKESVKANLDPTLFSEIIL